MTETTDSNIETPVRTITTRNRGWSRFLAGALVLHIPIFIYPILRLCYWLELSWWQVLLVFLPLASSQIVSRVYLRRVRNAAGLWFRRAADTWLGVSPVVLGLLLVAEVVVALSLVDPKIAAQLVIGAGCVVAFFGVISALSPVVKTISIVSDKVSKPVRLVQISDVHIGSRSIKFLEKVIFKINKLEPDFVCITGDLIDQAGIEEHQLKSLKSIVGPVYFSIGNHEKYEDLSNIVARLQNLGVKVLRNRSMETDEIQFIGIDDKDDPAQVGRELAKLDVAKDKFVVLLYHRPRGLESAADAGVDLMLSGHTHNGQIIPFNFVVNRVFDRPNGLYEYGNTRLYVSSGTGTWGPIMRIGTRSEITLFEVSPA